MKSIKLGVTVLLLFLGIVSCKQAERAPVPEVAQAVAEPAAEPNTGLEIGQIAPNFTQNDQNGKPVSLSDFRGKVVMIDFWATWCGPCVRAIPDVKELKKKYAGTDLVILGVSLDKDLGRWKSFIANEKMDWLHVADGNFWDNAAAKKYGIESIPSVWIIGAQGQILAKNLRGSQVAGAVALAMQK